MKFSERKGLVPVKCEIQADYIDLALKNSLWNALTASYWDHVQYDYSSSDKDNLLFRTLWISYFKETIDDMPSNSDWVIQKVKNYFFTCPWYQAYDFLEFIGKNTPNGFNQKRFKEYCNIVLERELSAYRFVGDEITEITSPTEITEIEDSLSATSSLKSVNVHLTRALELMSDRKAPDYRNSIKESISAVESLCNCINGGKTTLGNALKIIDNKVPIHPALKESFSKLYGYTSDADGIRHALLDQSTVGFEDAKFMLVSCSAFINFLIQKSAKAGISL